MEMAMVVTSIAEESAGATIFEPIERNGNIKRKRRIEAMVAPSDWRSRMQTTKRQQAQELTQLPQTVVHLANLVGAQATSEEAQRMIRMTWMQEKEQKWNARYEDEKVRGTPITNIIRKTMKEVPQGQEEREKKREVTAKTDGGGGRPPNMKTQCQKSDQRRASNRSSNRSPSRNHISTCSQNRSPCPSQIPYPHPRPPDGGRPSHPELRVRGHLLAQYQAQAQAPP
jgi:hypothetical protein